MSGMIHMTSTTYCCPESQDTLALGKRIGQQLYAGSVVTLTGPLGAGKTVLAKGIADALGIREQVVSPTYTIIQEYMGDLPLHHMDLYRIDSEEDFEMLGADEMLYGDGVTLIEWSEKISALLPPDHISVRIAIEQNGERMITIEGMTL